jgi:hypothetical protein
MRAVLPLYSDNPGDGHHMVAMVATTQHHLSFFFFKLFVLFCLAFYIF